MSEKHLKVGQKVEIVGKNVTGEIAFVGMTTFATGKWVGVILKEPVGKNNGSIKGTSYFSCAENCGMFVRPSQLVALDDAGNPIEMTTSGEKSSSRSRLSSSGSVRSVASTRPTTLIEYDHIHNLQAIMHQFLYGLNVCTPETLLKAGASIPEMIAPEKIIDGVVELLKANQLDENSSTDNLEKCITFFNAMYSV